MKQPIILLSFILFLSGYVSASGDGKRLELSVKKMHVDTSFVLLSLILRNRTDSALVFLTNNCCHYGLYQIDGQEDPISSCDCIMMKPEFIVLKPYGIFGEDIFFGIKQERDSFRLKMNLVEPKEKHNPKKAAKEKDLKKETLYTDYIQIK